MNYTTLDKLLDKIENINIVVNAASDCVFAYIREKLPHSLYISPEESKLLKHSKTLGGSYKYLVRYYKKQ
jgi:hypothetical protein